MQGWRGSALVGLALLAFSGCQPLATPQTAHGVVTDLQARGLGRADAVTVRTDAGEVLQFKVADSVQFSASHLREHMIFVEPVTVTYVNNGPDGNIATDITD